MSGVMGINTAGGADALELDIVEEENQGTRDDADHDLGNTETKE